MRYGMIPISSSEYGYLIGMLRKDRNVADKFPDVDPASLDEKLNRGRIMALSAEAVNADKKAT